MSQPNRATTGAKALPIRVVGPPGPQPDFFNKLSKTELPSPTHAKQMKMLSNATLKQAPKEPTRADLQKNLLLLGAIRPLICKSIPAATGERHSKLTALAKSCTTETFSTYVAIMEVLLYHFENSERSCPKRARYQFSYNNRLVWFGLSIRVFCPFDGLICDTVGRTYAFNPKSGLFQLLYHGKTRSQAFELEDGARVVFD